MLCKQNSGKYLTNEFHDLLFEGVIERERLNPDEIVWCELPDDRGNGKENPEEFEYYNQPVDGGIIGGRERLINLLDRDEAGEPNYSRLHEE